MARGDTASVVLSKKKLVLEFDTGAVQNEKPVLEKTRFEVSNTATTQQLYDAAYTLALYSTYSLYGIYIETEDEVGPIS